MKTTRRATASVIVAAVALLAAHSCAAATANRWQANVTTMNYGFFFSNDTSAVELTGLDLYDFDFDPAAGLGSWNIDVAGPSAYVFSSGAPASTITPFSGVMNLEIDYKSPVVQLEYAEVLFDGVDYTITRSRTLTHDSTQPVWAVWSTTNAFSALNTQFIDNYFGSPGATAVPLPNSILLLLSAGTFLGFTRRSAAVAKSAA